jgi:lysophospholipase L1-like esterase
MKTFRSVRAALFSTLSAFLLFGASPAKAGNFLNPDLKPGDRVVFAGDSITWLGTNATTTQGWILQFEQRVASQVPGVTMYNSGIPADTSTILLNRFKSTVLNVNPTVVVIWIGINDIPYLVPLETAQKNWNAMITLALRTPSVREIILVSPECKGEKRDGQNPYDAQIDAYASFLYQIAKAQYSPKIFYCPMRADWNYVEQIMNPDDLSSGILTTSPQGLHPNNMGHIFLKNVFCSEFNIKP